MAENWGERHPSDPEASWNRPQKQAKKKSTKTWCRGKEGVEHQPVVGYPVNVGVGGLCRQIDWLSRTNRKPSWLCKHSEICSECGKILKRSVRCPEKPDGMLQLWFDQIRV